MVEGKVISISNVAYVLGMSRKKLHRWYQKVLSGFEQARQNGELNANNLNTIDNGEPLEIKVPILEPNNLGKNLAIDEKNVDGVCYTLLSNRATSKIVLMADTLKVTHLQTIIQKIPYEQRLKVRSLTRDMAQNYDWFGRQAFPNAYHVADKFHVVKSAIEQLQAVRIRYRQELLGIQRQDKKDRTQRLNEVIYLNGDTPLQLLARSKGLLHRRSKQWTDQQRQRAQVLFKLYPEIETAYHMIGELRAWYRAPMGDTTYQKTRDKKKTTLLTLTKKMTQSNISEMMNLAHTIRTHQATICNYFVAKETNAKAEALNANIQRFVMTNYGTRNTDFFLFRLKYYFA